MKSPNWTWYATGPCHGIQKKHGKHKGRLIVSTNHDVANSKEIHSALIFSDDQGENWKLGAIVPETGGNESTVAELPDGRLILNSRNYHAEHPNQRAQAISKDGGRTFDSFRFCPELIEPVCQGSILQMSTGHLVFCNPATQKSRDHLTLTVSRDNGKTWNKKILINEGPAAYSDLVELEKGVLGVIYEYGSKRPYETIGFVRYDMNAKE